MEIVQFIDRRAGGTSMFYYCWNVVWCGEVRWDGVVRCGEHSELLTCTN